jgi:L-iditol 2-dehydrogenase
MFEKGTYSFPTVCGHEFAGTVERVGEGVASYEPGDRVAVFPLLWCGKCPACEEGKYVQCVDYDYLGSRSDGAFAEYVTVPERNLVRLPTNVSLEEAAMTEPAAVALHAVRRGGGTTVGETVAIFGAGPIGLMVAQWARALGASQVVLFDLQEEKIELSKRVGFELTFNSKKTDPLARILELTHGHGADLVIEAAGVPATFLQSLTVARRGGRVVLLGNPSKAVTIPVELISQVMRREITLYGTWNSDYSTCGNRDDWSDVLEAMANGALDLKSLITHRTPLSGSFEMMKKMKVQSEFYSKVLIYPDSHQS